MKRTFFRSLLSLTAVLTLAVGTASVAAAAEPTVGGELSAANQTITVKSNGNVPALVVMEAESVTLSETSFELQPGESHDLTFEGKAEGYVSATYNANLSGQETASATLRLQLTPRPPENPSPLGPAVLLLTLAAAVLLLLRRLRPWQYRLTRATP